MRLVDTHAHLDFKQFAGEEETVVARAREAGVDRIITVGTTLERSRRAVKLAERFDGVRAAVGIHPHEADAVTKEALSELKELAFHKEVVAVGEIGFDFHRDENPPKEVQGDAFLAQAAIAEEAGLPVIVHLRDGGGYALATLWEYANQLLADDPLRRWPGVIHCYTGNLEDAQTLLELGYAISFTAPITYPGNDELREVVKAVPLAKMMVETDCPFLPPVDKRGGRNEPSFVVETAAKIAELKRVSLEEVARVTTANAESLFGL